MQPMMTGHGMSTEQSKPYWLCCGSLEYTKHKSCTEHLEGYPERRRWGTAEEHSIYSKGRTPTKNKKSIYTAANGSI